MFDIVYGFIRIRVFFLKPDSGDIKAVNRLLSKSSASHVNEFKKEQFISTKINAIIFLNYKPSGRKVFKKRMLRNSLRLDEFFKLATSSRRKLKVGFDACCVSGVFARTNANSSMVDACDAGRFSMYVSEDLRVYPCSFQSCLATGDLFDNESSLLDIWTKSPNMQAFRNYFSSDRCGTCGHKSTCMNGCPLFDELVVCGHR